MAPCFLPGLVAEQVFSVLEVMEEGEDLKMILLMTSTACLRTIRAEEALSLCRADTANGAAVALARPAGHPGG